MAISGVSKKLSNMISIAGHHNMVTLGGVFLAAVGIAMIAGAAFPRWRKTAPGAGMLVGAAGVFIIFPYFASPPPPTALQIGSLVLAVLLETLAFVALMPAFYRRSERAVAAGTLAIVGAHFAVMLPALGIWIAALSGLCLTNAATLWLKRSYPIRTAWAADGALKLLIGSLMFLHPFVLGQPL